MNEPDEEEQKWERNVFLVLGIIAVIMVLVVGYYR